MKNVFQKKWLRRPGTKFGWLLTEMFPAVLGVTNGLCEHSRATAKIWGARASEHRLNFASKSSKGKILRAVKNFDGPFITPLVCCWSRDVFSRNHAFEPYNVRPQYGVVRVTIQRTRGYILMTKIIEEHSSNANHTVFFLRDWGLES